MRENLLKEACKYIPGGVNSPVRSFAAVGGYPIFVKEAKGAFINGTILDFCMSYGSLILGHSHPEVIAAVKDAVERGTTYGAPTESETKLARIITEAVPSMALVRLTNSGAEAVAGAVKLAKAFTKREKIVKFRECYHGFILDGCAEAEYNNINSVKKKIKDSAAVIIEPVGANNGVMVPRPGFLKELRYLCAENGTLLIFDEVVTGFRVGFSGAQGIFGITPDITTLGKIIGGGFPAGAFGGRRDVMEMLAPAGYVRHAGTFCGNPVTVTAGLATLNILKRDNPYGELERKTKSLGLVSFGSIFSFKGIRDFKEFYHYMLGNGIYLAPSEAECNFMSTAHTQEDVRRLYETIGKWQN